MDGAESDRRKRFEEEIEAMLRDKRVDGLVHLLEGKYFRWRDFVEDAVFESVVVLLATAERRDVENVTAFLSVVAERRLKRMIKRTRVHQDVDEVDFDEDNDLYDFGEADLAEVRATVRMLKEKMSGWTESMRVVTSLVLDAMAEEYPLTSGDLARDASAILGRQVTRDDCRTWKRRGLARFKKTLTIEQGGVR